MARDICVDLSLDRPPPPHARGEFRNFFSSSTLASRFQSGRTRARAKRIEQQAMTAASSWKAVLFILFFVIVRAQDVDDGNA